eukprot:COSAG02_NODE_203_length_29261_cov_20.960395_6_plen_173_part_00
MPTSSTIKRANRIKTVYCTPTKKSHSTVYTPYCRMISLAAEALLHPKCLVCAHKLYHLVRLGTLFGIEILPVEIVADAQQRLATEAAPTPTQAQGPGQRRKQKVTHGRATDINRVGVRSRRPGGKFVLCWFHALPPAAPPHFASERMSQRSPPLTTDPLGCAGHAPGPKSQH